MTRLLKSAVRLTLLCWLVGAMLALLTGCDQFFPYDKEPYQVCGVVDTVTADDGSGVDVGTAQLCVTKWRRAD